MANEAASRLLVSIEATTEQLRRELKNADTSLGRHDNTVKKHMASTRKQFADTAARVAKWGSAVSVAAAAAGAAMVKSGLTQIDSLAKTSAKLGIATDELAKLRFAAEQTGVSSNTLDMALQRMTRRVSEAAQGTGEAVKALGELGLNAKELAQQSPDQVFAKLSEAMKDVENPSDRLRLAFKLFDSEGAALVNTLRLTSDEMATLKQQAEAAGLAIGPDMASRVEAANDSINRVSSLFQGFTQQLAGRFASAIDESASAMFNLGTETRTTGEIADQVFGYMMKAAGFVGDALRGVEIAAKSLRATWTTSMTTILTGLEALLQGASELASLLPGINIDYESSTFAKFYDDMVHASYEAWGEIGDLINAPLPSDSIEAYRLKWKQELDEIESSARDASSTIKNAFSDNLNEASFWANEVSFAFEGVSETVNDAASESGTASNRIAEQSSAMATSVTRGFERMRDGVGDFFTQMLVDGKASFDGLLDMFKRVIAEMIATAATNRIMIGLGLGGGSSAASAAVSGLSSGVSGALSGSFGGASVMGGGFLANGMTNMMGNFAQTGAGTLNSLGISGFGQTSATLVGGGLNLGAGIVGGIGGTKLGESLFGRTANSSIGATIGGVAGTIFGAGNPIGALIGSAIGGLADAAFGSSNSDKWVNYQFGPNGAQLTRDTGKPLSQDAAEAGVHIVESIAAALGGSNSSFEVSGGRKSGLRIDGQVFGSDAEGFSRAAFDLLIDGADQFSDVVKDLARNFQGTTEDAVLFTQAFASIEGMIESNPVSDAISDFESLQDAASNTFFDSFNSIADATRQLAVDYDGTATSAANLAQGLQSSQQAAYEMSMTILSLSDQLQKASATSAQSIRESVMSEEERRKSWLSRRDSLRDALDTITDPQKITESANEILRLNRQIFDSLGPEQQAGAAETYAKIAEDVGAVAASQYEEALNEVRETQKDVAERVSAVLNEAAEQQQAAADTQLSAAQIIAQAASLFSQGQTVRVSFDGPEVMA